MSWCTSDGAGGSVEQTATLTITGTDDAPTITGNTAGAVTENSGVAATGELTVTDPDTGEEVAPEGAVTMTGGAGADRFVIADDPALASVTIAAFDPGEGDRLDLSAFGFADFAAVEAVLGDDAGRSCLQFDADSVLILDGFAPGLLAPAHVILEVWRRPGRDARTPGHPVRHRAAIAKLWLRVPDPPPDHGGLPVRGRASPSVRPDDG